MESSPIELASPRRILRWQNMTGKPKTTVAYLTSACLHMSLKKRTVIVTQPTIHVIKILYEGIEDIAVFCGLTRSFLVGLVEANSSKKQRQLRAK